MSEHSNRILRFGKAPRDRRGVNAESNALFIKRVDDHVPALCLATKERDAQPKDISAKLLPTEPCDNANARPCPSSICAAHADFVATLAGHPPRTIPLDADAIDLEDRATHLSEVFGALSVYLAVILDDTAQNVPGRLDLPDVEAHLSELASGVAGLIERAAEDMRGWIA